MGLFSNKAGATAVSDEKKKPGIPFKAYQDLKSSVHRELLSKVDLEKIASMRDVRIRGQNRFCRTPQSATFSSIPIKRYT